MNKIKLIYDVITTMKEKENIKGSLIINGKKNQIQFVQFENEFQRNFETGDVKAKISLQFDYEGKKMNHESSVEFNLENSHDKIHPHFHRHMHHNNHGGMHRHNFKEKLSMLAMILKLIDDMKIEEQADCLLVSLSLNELPEEFMRHAQKKMQHHNEGEHQRHPFPLKNLITMEKPSLLMILQLSKNKEVQKISITVEGKQSIEDNEIHDLNFNGELCLTY